jgi:signal transduction histidine kinase/DNA-binding NarL/FixJ family response regulator
MKQSLAADYAASLAENTEGALSPPLILVVDDEIPARVLLKHILKADGYLMAEAGDGVQALAMFQLLQPDLVLLDAMMPEMNGFETCAKIRALPEGRQIPIIMVTALDDDNSVSTAFAAGATDYIIKPFHRAVVRHRVRLLTRAGLAEKALHQSHARYRDLFEEAPISLWEEDFSQVKHYLDRLSADGISDFAAYFNRNPHDLAHCISLIKVIDVNKVTLQLYEAPSKDALIGRFTQALTANSLPLVKDQLLALAQGNTHFVGEAPGKTLAGRDIIIKLRWSVAPGFEKSYAKVLVSVTDVTEQRQMTQTLLAAQKLAGLGTLAAGIAHEINSPLQVIIGVSEILLGRLERQQELPLDYLGRKLENIHRNGWRCAEIVRSLKMYAYTAANGKTVCGLNDIVRDTLLLIEHQLVSWSGITVNSFLKEDIPPLECDRNQISQLLINLLTNARDVMPNGGTISIATQYIATANQLVLTVTDSGPGIPDSIRSKIFDPFFTTKPVGQGTGLGLFIVHGIVKAHNGQIEVSSSHEGTSFVGTFPVAGSGVVDNRAEPVGRFADRAGNYTGKLATPTG